MKFNETQTIKNGHFTEFACYIFDNYLKKKL